MSVLRPLASDDYFSLLSVRQNGMGTIMRNIITMLLIGFLSACGTARTLAVEPVSSPQSYTNLKLVAHNPTVNVPAEVTEKLESVIRTGLFEKDRLSLAKT
jgi:hypothetical protein